MIDYKAIGRRIAHYRTASHLTQSVLSEKIGVSVSYISQIESGRQQVSLNRLDSIAEALNIDVIYLIADTNPDLSNYGYMDFANTIQSRSPEQKQLLLALLKCVDEQLFSEKRAK